MEKKLPVKEFDPLLSADFIESKEGFRSEAYQCPAQKGTNNWTIGYGHTKGVKKGMTISRQQGRKLLEEDLPMYQNDLASIVKVPITEGMFIALMSFIYNFGLTKCKGYSLFKCLNDGDKRGTDEKHKFIGNGYERAYIWFPDYRSPGSTYEEGLLNRRKDEQRYFCQGTLF